MRFSLILNNEDITFVFVHWTVFSRSIWKEKIRLEIKIVKHHFTEPFIRADQDS